MRSLTVAVLVLLGTVTVGVSPAAAASFTVIGQFSWDMGFPELGIDPIFTFENTSTGLLANLSLELDTTEGIKTFAFVNPLETDTEGNASPNIPAFGMSQISSPDLSAFIILEAFIRSQETLLYLLDPSSTPLIDAAGRPLGLNGGTLITAQVAVMVPNPPPPDSTPVPEPGTLTLLGLGAVGALLRSRRR